MEIISLPFLHSIHNGLAVEEAPWLFSSSKSVCIILGGTTLGRLLSSSRGGCMLCSAVIFKRGIIFTGTTPSIQDGRRIGFGMLLGGSGSVDNIGEDELRDFSFREPAREGLGSRLRPPPAPLPLILLKKRFILVHFPFVFYYLVLARISGSLLHFSRVRIKVFLRKYFLLWTYLEMASAQLCRHVNLAHSSAQSPRPLSRLLGFAAEKLNQFRTILIKS